MKCKEIQQRILDLEGDNHPGCTGQVDDHLLACPECRQFYDQARRSWDAMDSLPEIEPSQNFNAATWGKIRLRRNRFQALTMAFSGRSRWVMAGAVLVLIGLAAGYLALRPVSAPLAPRVEVTTGNDQEDSQLLLELDALVNDDESRLLNTFQEWETSSDAGNGPGEKVPPPERERRPPERLNLNREARLARPGAA